MLANSAYFICPSKTRSPRKMRKELHNFPKISRTLNGIVSMQGKGYAKKIIVFLNKIVKYEIHGIVSLYPVDRLQSK